MDRLRSFDEHLRPTRTGQEREAVRGGNYTSCPFEGKHPKSRERSCWPSAVTLVTYIQNILGMEEAPFWRMEEGQATIFHRRGSLNWNSSPLFMRPPTLGVFPQLSAGISVQSFFPPIIRFPPSLFGKCCIRPWPRGSSSG